MVAACIDVQHSRPQLFKLWKTGSGSCNSSTRQELATITEDEQLQYRYHQYCNKENKGKVFCLFSLISQLPVYGRYY